MYPFPSTLTGRWKSVYLVPALAKPLLATKRVRRDPGGLHRSVLRVRGFNGRGGGIALCFETGISTVGETRTLEGVVDSGVVDSLRHTHRGRISRRRYRAGWLPLNQRYASGSCS